MRAAHETTANQTDVERPLRAHLRSLSSGLSLARGIASVPVRTTAERSGAGQGSPSLNGGSLSAGTPCSAIASSMATGDKVCPFYLRTLASNVHKSGGISTVERHPGPVAAAVTCWIERANEANGKSPPELFRRALIVLLSARDRSARIIENGSCKPALKPIARGEILNPIPSRPVHVMATAIVRVHRYSRNSRFRVARDGGGNNSRFMMSSVSVIVTISLGERRRTEQSDSRYRY